MGGVREIKKKETRKAILQAAIRLFAENGVENTSMETLARAAGVGKSTIYGYFRNKQEIFLEFCEEEMDYAFLRLAEQPPGAPVGEQLLTLFTSQFHFVTENREFGRLMIREMAFPREPTCGPARDLNARYLEKIEEILRRGVASGEIRADHDAFLTSVHFISLYIVALSGWYTGYVASESEVEQSLRTLLNQALDGLRVSSEKQLQEDISV